MTTIEELDAKISEMSQKLMQSQCANSYPEQYPQYQRLSSKEHFDLWDEMLKLIQERDELKDKT